MQVLPSKPDVAQLTDLQWTSVNYLSNLNKKFRSLATDLDHEIEVELGDYHLVIKVFVCDLEVFYVNTSFFFIIIHKRSVACQKFLALYY